MAEVEAGQWANYTYVVPHVYTRAKVQLIGLGNYTPAGTITNDFFAYITSRLGEPRSEEHGTSNVRKNRLTGTRGWVGHMENL